MKHTPAQKKAIHAKGNILVVAGAGTGKTRTLIDRCMKQLIDPEAVSYTHLTLPTICSV